MLPLAADHRDSWGFIAPNFKTLAFKNSSSAKKRFSRIAVCNPMTIEGFLKHAINPAAESDNLFKAALYFGM